MISIGTFRRNVMKTVATKAAKLGLKTVSRSTIRTALAFAIVSLAASVGALMRTLSQYVLGLQITQEMKEGAFVSLGDVGYDLTVLCRLLKVHMPTATKKVKLAGTRTAAILQLESLTTDLVTLVKVSLFANPQMKKVKKIVVLPNKGGVKEEREVNVVDMDAEVKVEGVRQAQMKSIMTGIVDVYWRLCFDLFQKSPAELLEAKFDRMRKEFPDIQFAGDLAASK